MTFPCARQFPKLTAAGSYEPSILSGSRRWRTRNGESKWRKARGRKWRCSRQRWLRGWVGVSGSFRRRVPDHGGSARPDSRAHGTVRVPSMLRLRPATDSAVPGGSPDLQLLPPKAKLLPDLPRPAHTEHPEPGHGESSLHTAVPLQGKTPEVSTYPSQLKLTSRWKLHFLMPKLLRGEGGGGMRAGGGW